MNFTGANNSMMMDTTMTTIHEASKSKTKQKMLTLSSKKPKNTSSALFVRTKSTNLVASSTPTQKAPPYAKYLPQNFMHKYVTNNNKTHCELCDYEFKKVSLDKDQRRTHCRRCGKSICSWCGSNYLQISQSDQTKHKCCDQCASEIENLHIKHTLKQRTDLLRLHLQQTNDRIKQCRIDTNQQIAQILEQKSKVQMAELEQTAQDLQFNEQILRLQDELQRHLRVNQDTMSRLNEVQT